MTGNGVNSLPLPPGQALSTDQARRVTCAAVAVRLFPAATVTTQWAIARWLERGTLP